MMNMNDTPKVSVIITTYRNEGFISEAIQSVLNQDYDDYEIIVTEDCGGDGTYEEALAFSSDKVRVFQNPKNLGQHRNKMRAVGLSRGKLLKFVDGDDFMLPGGLRHLVETYDKYEGEAGFILGRTRRVDEKGNFLCESPHWGCEGLVEGVRVLDLLLDIRGSGSRFGNVSGHLIDRDLLERAGGFPESNAIAGDWELFLKMLTLGNVVFTEQLTAAYRTQPGSVGALTKTLPRLIDDFGSLDRIEPYFLNIPSVRQKIAPNGLMEFWATRFLGRHIFPNLFRNLLGRENVYDEIREEFCRRGLEEELRKALLIDAWWYAWMNLERKIRRCFKMKSHSPVFKRFDES